MNGAVVARERLPVLHTGKRAPVWWAMMLLVVIESTVFTSLFLSYLYLRFGAHEWPPAGIGAPNLLLPTINTFVLLASALAILWASHHLKRGDERKLRIGLGAGLLLEILFFAIKVVETGGVEFRWDDHAYGSIYWSINVLHAAHVVAAILMASVAFVLAMRGFFTRERRLGIEAVSIYWNFVALIWLGVYVVLYLVPRWF